MVLWADEYRPKSLDALELHTDVSDRLKKLAQGGDIPHLMFFGPSGAGKRTRINALLREIFGSSVDKVRMVQRTVETKSKEIEIPSLVSSFHIEINASDAGNADTHVIQDVIKSIAETQSPNAYMRFTAAANNANNKMSDSNASAPPPFKVVVLHEVDKLSIDAQHGLRRTMEQYSKYCRLILCAESSSRVIAPLTSRCLLVRVPAPTEEQVRGVMDAVLTKLKLKSSSSNTVLNEIVEKSDRSLRKALLLLETTYVCSNGNLSDGAVVKVPEWELYVKEIARNIVKEQSPAQLQLIRGQLYQLLGNCIPADIILRHIALELCSLSDTIVQHQIMRWKAFYDHRISLGTKPVFHLEAFVAKIMTVLKAIAHK